MMKLDFLLQFLESCCELKDSYYDAADRSGQALEVGRFALMNCLGDCD